MILSSDLFGAFAAPHHVALWAVSSLALVAYAVALWNAADGASWPRRALLLGWGCHGLAIVLDVSGVGSLVQGARFGFATVMSATSWLVLAVYAIESRWVPLSGVRRSMALMGAVAVGVAAVFPGESRPLAVAPWAPLHWAMGIASYGLFGAAVLHAAMLDAAERRLRLKKTPGVMGMPLLRLERLTFQFVAAGFFLLSCTLVLGWWFAQPWRWDHKAVFSLLGWLVFAGLLLGRLTLGWRGRHAIRWLYAGSVLLFLAYVGSRFILDVVLQRPAH